MFTHLVTDSEETIRWVNEVWAKVEKKLSRTVPSVGDAFFPYTTEKGRFINNYDKELNDWWTDGFWTGILWRMYESTKKPMYREYGKGLKISWIR